MSDKQVFVTIAGGFLFALVGGVLLFFPFWTFAGSVLGNRRSVRLTRSVRGASG